MTEPLQPTHLDQRDPAMDGVRDIRDEADREIDAYDDRAGLVLLMPEDRWADFLRLTGATAQAQDGGKGESDETTYRGVIFRKAAVTAVVAQEGF
ncbi:MAG TPA: hypothetical protein VFE18_07780 [Phenylobacterium sp.]|jgi:hypothetical protein|uniref:hypothetical protein n=1 Tax=Phenylobacterium sp. TaxID=1871053 RepID=UPI002D5CD48B|nr:hypothetical protein [Phenylobacterium sp.]HZZ68059.1 hypothetical protein [Phenylobacterium sp.]